MSKEWSEYLKEIDDAWNTLPQSALEARFLEIDARVKADYGSDSRVYGAMRNEIGAFYKGEGRFSEAEACFGQAVDIFQSETGKESSAYATALNNLAGTHRLMGEADKAETEFMSCLELYAATVGRNHVLYAAGLNNLSLCCLDKGDFSQAAELLRRASDILSGLPDRWDELAVSLINLGCLYQRLGRLDEADEKLTQALRMFREKLGTDTPHYHAALNGLGAVHYAQKRFKEAVSDFTAAAEAARLMYGPDHYEVKAAEQHAEAARKAEGKRS